MLDHLLGRPSASYKRSHALLVLVFWSWVLVRSPPGGPRVGYLRRLNRLLQRFTPWQIILATLTAVYALRHVADLVGLGSPEPLSRLYSRSYYRATWIATAFDVGLATAMPIRPKWVRDLAGFLFAGYYIVYANEADEKLRKFRSEATVEMLRTTWEKPLNPWVRLITRPYRPSLPCVKTLLIPRPAGPRAHLPPVKVVLFYDGPPPSLSPPPFTSPSKPTATPAPAPEIVLDFPGGGFISMGPGCHEERLRFWARRFGRGRKEGSQGRRMVVSVDYGKSPEYPYPWAIDECFDLYLAIVRSNGAVIGLETDRPVELVLTGDSAGANIVCTVLFNLLESPLAKGVRRPKAVVLAYAALDFNFTSWMSRENLRVLREETGVKRRTASGVDLSGLEQAKDHLAHRSPLAVVHDLPARRPSTSALTTTTTTTITTGGGGGPSSALKRTRSWSQALGFGSLGPLSSTTPTTAASGAGGGGGGGMGARREGRHKRAASAVTAGEGSLSGGSFERSGAAEAADVQEDEEEDGRADEWKALRERVRTPKALWRAPSSSSTAAAAAAAASTGGGGGAGVEVDPFDSERTLGSGKPRREGADGADDEDEEGEEEEPRFGTRLTMTSRSGYFQDRIITPSMMRAMAILYIGPSQNPDLHSDYYISPILAPARLLAQFPPALLVCGEKDPFVDDTVIIAGRIREARAEAGVGGSEGDDWVRMEIMEGWGHGYLQMVALMPEIKGVLEDIAEYMDDAFADALFPGSSVSASPELSTTATQQQQRPARSWLSRLFGSAPSAAPTDDGAADGIDLVVEMPTPVTPPPSVMSSPPTMRSPPVRTSDLPSPSNPSPAAPAGATVVDEDGTEPLAFTPKRLRSPPLTSSPSSRTASRAPRHGILKKPPPSSIALPPPFSPNELATPPAAASGNGIHQPPNPKTLPSLLAAALTRSLTPPSSVAASAAAASPSAGAGAAGPPGAGTPALGTGAASSSILGTPMLGPGGGKAKRAAIDERELMRRRRVDAVFGMDAVEGGGGPGGGPSTGDKKRKETAAAGDALEEEMEEFLL